MQMSIAMKNEFVVSDLKGIAAKNILPDGCSKVVRDAVLDAAEDAAKRLVIPYLKRRALKTMKVEGRAALWGADRSSDGGGGDCD